jgi:transposase
LLIGEADRLQLRALVRSRSMPHSLVRRARIVLLSGEGRSNREVARRCGVSAPAVSHGRGRYQERGLAGLHDELRPGRPRTHDDEKVAELINLVVQRKPDHATQWSVRSAAAITHIPKSTVGRYFALFGLQPHRSQSFKLSTDPFFVEKVREIVGLYLNPPDQALVLWVDEKRQVQALERTQPGLPMGLGYVEGVTHDYYRHGTTTLFAALDTLDGKMITRCKPRHRHQGFRALLNHLDRSVPAGLDIHLVADNYGIISIRRLRPGWRAGRATTSTTPRPPPAGSIRWSAGSASSPSRQFGAGHSAASASWCRKSTPMSPVTICIIVPSRGPLLPTPSLQSFNAFVRLLMGHHTR